MKLIFFWLCDILFKCIVATSILEYVRTDLRNLVKRQTGNVFSKVPDNSDRRTYTDFVFGIKWLLIGTSEPLEFLS